MIDLNTVLLIIAALLPAIILSIYIYKKDRVEKEPLTLLLKLFFFGALICFPAAYIEEFVIGIIDGIFGEIYEGDSIFYIYNFIYYFIGVALVEEGVKLLVLKYTVQYNNNFDCFFDGVIYAVFVSLGFAALENIFYVLQYGFSNAILRGILSVPGHMFFGVMMGYYYSRWMVYKKADAILKKLKLGGYIDSKSVGFEVNNKEWLVLLIPVLIHGFYDFCCTIDSIFFTLLFLGFITFLYIYCFRKIKRMSNADEYNNIYAMSLVFKKYPHLKERDIEIDLVV